MRSTPARQLGASAALVVFLLACACGTGVPAKLESSSPAAGQLGVTFNVNVSKPVGGRIYSSVDDVADGKINCGTGASACAEVSYPWARNVTFTAQPDSGFKFVGWLADCTGTDPTCTVGTAEHRADKWVAAAFVPDATYRGVYFLVHVTKPTGGLVTSPDGQIRCGTAANQNVCGPALYRWADTVTLSVAADPGFGFDGWTGDCSGATCSLSTTPNGTDKTVNAALSLRPPRSCNVANGTGTQTWNGTAWEPCVITGCDSAAHLESGACVPNTKACAVANGTGTETWNGYGWSACQVTGCEVGFHQEGTICEGNARACTVPNGTGSQQWSGGAWSPCVFACNAGYHLFQNACIADVARCAVTPFSSEIAPGGSLTLRATAYDANDNVLSGRGIAWQVRQSEAAAVTPTTGTGETFTVTARASRYGDLTAEYFLVDATCESKPSTSWIAIVDPVVGCYAWFNGGVVTVDRNNGILHDNPADSGVVVVRGDGNYRLFWDSGFTDDMALDGAGNLAGANWNGNVVAGTRVPCR